MIASPASICKQYCRHFIDENCVYVVEKCIWEVVSINYYEYKEEGRNWWAESLLRGSCSLYLIMSK